MLDHDEKIINALKRMVKIQYSLLVALNVISFDFGLKESN